MTAAELIADACRRINEMPDSWASRPDLFSDKFTIPVRPSRHRGTDAAGHRVYVTATKTEIASGEQTAFCGDCGAWVLPTWEQPEQQEPSFPVCEYTVFIES